MKSLRVRVEDGEINALDAYIELKRQEKEIKEQLSAIQDEAISEAQKFGEKTFDYKEAKVEVKNAAGRWSFKHLDWHKEAKDKEEAAKNAYKAAIKGEQYITSDGEVVEPAEYTEGKTTIAIKL